MSYPIFIKRSSTLKPDDMFYFFDCGDLWVRKNVNLQDDIERCFDIILPSMSTLANNVIKYFGWAMKYTVPHLDQIKGLKDNQVYKIIEETEESEDGEITNENHNENFIDPIRYDGKTLEIVDDIFLYPPEMLIDLIKKFKDVKNIRLYMSQMRGGFLDTEDDDEYIIKTIKNPDWHSISLSAKDQKDIENLKEIKEGIDSKIKFDLSAFPEDEINIFKSNKIT